MSVKLDLTGGNKQFWGGLVLQGGSGDIESLTDVSSLTDSGDTGILIADAEGAPSDVICINGALVKQFNGSGLKYESHALLRLAHSMHAVIARGCYIGAELTGQYGTLSNFFGAFCKYGIKITSGNMKVIGGTLCENHFGLWLYGGPNNAHGQIIGLTSNHNFVNLWCQDVTLGETFSGCHFIAGDINIENSKGIQIEGGQIGNGTVTVDATSELILRGVMFTGPVNFIVEEGGILDAQGCHPLLNATYGGVMTLNGSPWSGNTAGVGSGGGGSIDAEVERDSYTTTLTGVSGTVTYTMEYQRTNDEVSLTLASSTAPGGTSNATTKTLTGMPEHLWPASPVFFFGTGTDSATGTPVVSRFKIDTDGVIYLHPGLNGETWTASGSMNVRLVLPPYLRA